MIILIYLFLLFLIINNENNDLALNSGKSMS